MSDDSGRDPAATSQAHHALMRVYCAIDRVAPRNPRVPLDVALRELAGVVVGEVGSPASELRTLAEQVDGERSGEPAAVLPLHRVVEAAVDVAALDQSDELAPALNEIAEQLVKVERRDDSAATISELARVLEGAAPLTPRERSTEIWARLRAVGGADLRAQDHPLQHEVHAVRSSSCADELFGNEGEYVSYLETTFELPADLTTMDDLAWACVPTNWPARNRYFCSVTYDAARTNSYNGTTGGSPDPGAGYWRVIVEEKVRPCPQGAFPNTFLICTWDRAGDQVLLRYKLDESVAGRVLKIDEGQISIDTLATTFQITTSKYLLFDDQHVPSGGQTLGAYACRLGWLDYSIAQFSQPAGPVHGDPSHLTAAPAADPAASSGPSVPPQPPMTRDRLLAQLEEARQQCASWAHETAADIDGCRAAAGDKATGFDEHMAAALAASVRRGGRNGARLVGTQLDIAVSSLDVMSEVIDGWRRARG